jgi:hypothetical protein
MIDVPTFAGARPQPGPLCWYFLIPFTACDTNFFLTQSVSMQKNKYPAVMLPGI